MKVYCMSDLHVDFEENREALFDLRQHDYGQDAMIVAGDISDDLELVRLTLSTLKSIFREIFYVPGNHELWLTDKDKQIFGLHNSVEKFQYICNLCDELGIQTKPMLLASAEVWVAPLFSWYSVDFDETFDHEADLRYQKLFDCQCKWPFQIKFDSSSDSHSVSLSSYFAEINASRGHLRRLELFPIISFSHFVPRKDLLPKRESLRFKHLYRYAGNPLIEQQLRHLGSSTHIFGHTHIPCDKVISGVRYFSLPFAYPEERHRMQRFFIYFHNDSPLLTFLEPWARM
eukprot:TRINITY_DN1881_c0_g1_i8.p1 TRINITY_DN1881_c0_g1~~TRINITY_DN1881_c0_g1_i8.p1  ORF type:complete len:287 (+),score=42.78 TRINITY_DN1881_c0_g1_i8:85-945(+)